MLNDLLIILVSLLKLEAKQKVNVGRGTTETFDDETECVLQRDFLGVSRLERGLEGAEEGARKGPRRKFPLQIINNL